MEKTRKSIQPEDVLSEALQEGDELLTERDVSLLVSGFKALREAKNKPLNKKELKSIKSLINYIAYEQCVDQDFVETVLLAEFNVSTLEKIVAKDYQAIVEYLVDLKVEMILN